MKPKSLFTIAIMGVLAGVISAYIYNVKVNSQPPLAMSSNPYVKGIYATGILESDQPNGSNINIYPEVSGQINHIFAREGQFVKAGTPLFTLDNTVQAQIVEKDKAQFRFEQANLINAQQQLTKIQKSYTLNSHSVSKNALDNAINTARMASESLNLALMQYRADNALLNKYTVNSPIDGMVLRIATAVGNYVSPQGTYDTYTQQLIPIVQMGIVSPYLQVRCFLDEILVPQLPPPTKIEATLFVRGEMNKSIPLQFVSIQPYTIPNIQLSNERQERVDMRVLPIIFKFKKPPDVNLFPGQLVDIYIKGKK
jgi:HlyD family secretion protein